MMAARWKRQVVGLVFLVAAGAAAPFAPAGADPALGGYVATAVAYGGRVTFTVPKFVIVADVIDVGGPLSQSVVDPFRADAFASLPYPGDAAIGAPGLFQAVTGVAPPGGYPLYVAASYPTEPDHELQDPSGLYALSAKTGAGTSAAVARFSGQGGQGQQSATGGGQATTSTVEESGVVTVMAQTVNEAINLGGGALRIASVRSKAVTTYNGQGAPQTKTELVMEGGSAGGFSFAYGPQGLVVGQGGTPVPATSGLDQLNAAVAPSGLHLGFAGVKELVGGASANALEVTFQGKSPVPGVPDGIVTIRFGAATTTVALSGPPAGPDPSVDTASDTTDTGTGYAPTPTGLPAVETGAGSDGLTGVGTDDQGAPVTVTNDQSGSAELVGSPSVAGASEQASAGERPFVEAAPTATLRVQRAVSPWTLASGGFLVWPLVVGGATLPALCFLLWRPKGVLRP